MEPTTVSGFLDAGVENRTSEIEDFDQVVRSYWPRIFRFILASVHDSGTARRTKSVIPTGQIGNDRPIEITDERWESADLKLLVRSHHHDPRTGDVEYRLTNIVRVEPQPDLFIVPSDYTIVGSGRGGIGAGTEPGLRTGGARGGNQSGGGARAGAPAN